MKNKERWRPTKYDLKDGCLRASKNPKEVYIGSRFFGNIIAKVYSEKIPLHCRGALLDIGCGNVPFYGLYKRYVTENICVDWINTNHKNPFLDNECDITKKLPFEKGQFDTIIISDVLEHVFNPLHVWNEMHRIMKPGGKVLANVPFLYWLHEEPYDYYRYTEHSLRSMVDRAGFRLLELNPYGGAPEVITDILAKSIIPWFRYGCHFSIILQNMMEKISKTNAIRKISEATQHKFPLMYFILAQKSE